MLCMAKVEQALRPVLNFIVYYFDSSECVFNSQHILPYH